jgi:hypothetical protein
LKGIGVKSPTVPSLQVLSYELSKDILHFCDFLVAVMGHLYYCYKPHYRDESTTYRGAVAFSINFFTRACQNQMVTPPNKEGSVILHAVFYYDFSEFVCPPLPHHYDLYCQI